MKHMRSQKGVSEEDINNRRRVFCIGIGNVFVTDRSNEF